MASDVDISNLALGHLGDKATVASLDPPEGSIQAEHCARFYPIARDGLLEMHAWGFATRRIALAQLTAVSDAWDYCYGVPPGMLNALAVVPADATDDYSQQYGTTWAGVPLVDGSQAKNAYVPRPFVIETLDDGTEVILTDEENAVLRYTVIVTDTAKFSPLFVTTLSWYLASMLAGPIIKGDAGREEAARCLKIMQSFLDRATESDANQRRIRPVQNVGWISGR